MVKAITMSNRPQATHSKSSDVYLKTYPNPFTDNTNIEFILNYDSKVRIEVFNVNGLLIGNIYNGNITANQKYTVNLYAENYKPGIYLLRLITEQSVFNQKLIILKK